MLLSKPIAVFSFSLPYVAIVVVVIQKFCDRGNVTSHFSSLLRFMQTLGENSAHFER